MHRALVLFALLTACGGESTTAPPPEKTPAKAEKAKVKAPPAGSFAAAPSAPAEAQPEWKLPEGAAPELTDPKLATKSAPATFKAKFSTTKGEFIVQVDKSWAPLGADRFYNLVEIGFFDQVAVFRAIPNFMAQFGISGYPEVAKAWRDADIKDDEFSQSNTRGRLSFATRGPNTRTTQMFINYKDNINLDGMGFTPIGEVVSGMEIVDSLYQGYGEGAPRGRGPDQGKLQMKGNAYLKEKFPKLDYIVKVEVVQ